MAQSVRVRTPAGPAPRRVDLDTLDVFGLSESIEVVKRMDRDPIDEDGHATIDPAGHGHEEVAERGVSLEILVEVDAAVPGSGVPIRAIVELFESGDPVPAPLDDDEGVESDRLGAHADLYGNHLGIGNVDDGGQTTAIITDAPDGQRVAAGVRGLEEEEAE